MWLNSKSGDGTACNCPPEYCINKLCNIAKLMSAAIGYAFTAQEHFIQRVAGCRHVSYSVSSTVWLFNVVKDGRV